MLKSIKYKLKAKRYFVEWEKMCNFARCLE
jgi:hypothetical protein